MQTDSIALWLKEERINNDTKGFDCKNSGNG